MTNRQANVNRCRLMSLHGLYRHQIGGVDYSPRGVMAGAVVYRTPKPARLLVQYLRCWGYNVWTETTAKRFAPRWEQGYRVHWDRPGRLAGRADTTSTAP